MKVLHLYANHKWTGPAELALQLARGLQTGSQQSGTALDLQFALAGFVHPGMQHAMRARAEELGVHAREGLALRRHFHLPSLLADAARLGSWIQTEGIDLLHCHQSGDHLLAALARSLSRPIPIVRSYWEESVGWSWPRQAYAFAATAAVLTPFEDLVGPLVHSESLPTGRVLLQEPMMQMPAAAGEAERAGARAALLDELGLEAPVHLVGITARIQRRRRWDLLWDLVSECSQADPACQLLVLGRPDEGVFAEICERPLEERGVLDRVHFLGYRRGDAYRQALVALDAFLFLVPGSDPTCRALREAMALGLPAVTSDLGHLTTIVQDGVSGFCRTPVASSMSQALLHLLRDESLRKTMGASARRQAEERWGGDRQIQQTLSLYESLLGGPP